MRKFVFISIWLISLIIVSIGTYENPEMIDFIKENYNLQKYLPSKVKVKKGPSQVSLGNSFAVELSQEIYFPERTAFVIHDENVLNFNQNSLKIYFQNGYLLKKGKLEKLNLPKTFTKARNGGIKTIFVSNNKEFAFISSKKDECFYSSIVSLENGREIFKTKCLPMKQMLDYNGLGSSNIHLKNNILLSIGAPEQVSYAIAKLSQDSDSMYGKILQINKSDLDSMIMDGESNLDVKIFTMGHRNPQGLTKIDDSIFSVEHGPKGGDELNKIIKEKNYGWPIASYGTRYGYDQEEKSYKKNHEINKFEEPLFALVPSVGISAVNICPTILKDYYKKPCLLVLSLYGNNLRPGRSILIYLLNEKMDKVHSVEKIYIQDDWESSVVGHRLRHFVTNSKNELYEDKDGSIYVSVDKKGIYKLRFIGFTR